MLTIVGGLSFAWFQFILFMSFFKEQKADQIFNETITTSYDLDKRNKCMLKWAFDNKAANMNQKPTPKVIAAKAA
jgi:hypothetical protein